MSAEPELQVVTTLSGADAIREFIDNSFDFDQNDCDDVAVVNGDWGAAANTFTNSANGTSIQGVNIVQIDADGKIARHFVHMEAPV